LRKISDGWWLDMLSQLEGKNAEHLELTEHMETSEDNLLFRVFRVFKTVAPFQRAGTAMIISPPKDHIHRTFCA
jgi:hypothetical protein